MCVCVYIYISYRASTEHRSRTPDPPSCDTRFNGWPPPTPPLSVNESRTIESLVSCRSLRSSLPLQRKFEECVGARN